MTQVGIVADDLTGAFDAAAPFAARGMTTLVATAPDGLATDGDVVSLTTASRHLPAAEAQAAVKAGYAAMARLAPAVWFKKIDSTLRGHVAVELVAGLAASGRTELVVTPAVPSQGRTVVGGEVHVHGVPLGNTVDVHDAISGTSARPLAEQLAAADPSLVCEVVRNEPPRAGRRAWIADASCDGDLAAIADWALQRAETALLAGAAGLGSALAGALVPEPLPPRLPGAAARPILSVLGSRAAAGRRQAEALLARGDCEDWLAPCGQLDVDKVVAGTGDALLRVTTAETDAQPEAVAVALGESVAAVLERRHFGTLLVTGGDTAASVLAALGIHRVVVLGEVAPNVPLSRLLYRGRQLCLVTKAGAFGEGDLFASLPGLLCAS